MSREQLTEQEGQQDEAAQDAKSAEDVQGLPPRIYRQVMAIKQGPGDAEALAELMAAFDGVFADRIAAVAARAPHLGNRLVQAAIQISSRAQPAAPEAAPGKMTAGEQSEFRASNARSDAALTDDLSNLDGGIVVPLSAGLRAQVLALKSGDAPQLAQLLAQCPSDQHDALLLLARQHLGGATVAQAVEIKQAGPDPQAAWTAAAEAYNNAHSDLVDEFNDLTNDSCRLDASVKLDVVAVSHWQRNHGLAADGKVGPHTVETARKLKAVAPAQVASAPQADARPPV
ncbi:MAG TPA: hypothetical protein VK607_12760 [Kofleriaceae bacterium]|nr:hypothetical protein [Kofleriaceae bacterium]